MEYKGAGKRNRDDRNSSESDTTPQKFKSKPSTTTINFLQELEDQLALSSDSDYEPQSTDLSTPKITDLLKPKSSAAKMDKLKHPEIETTPWIGIKNELLAEMKTITNEIKGVKLEIAELIKSNLFLQTTAEEAKKEAELAVNKAQVLEKTVEEQNQVIDSQKKKIASLEAYSKYYNLKFFNVPETTNENTNSLLDNFRHILAMLEINPSTIYIDTIHRLPNHSKGPRPLIVKFVSKLDRDLVWSKKNMFSSLGLKIFVREHFDEITERNIRKLLPIRRAAINLGKKVRLAGDKLTIDGQKFTVENLADLPSELRPERLAHKQIENFTFFFSEATPLSNFHPSVFTVDGNTYKNGESYIQATKARMFGDQPTLNRIMLAKTPGEAKSLGARVQGFSKDIWSKEVPVIAFKCVEAKFQQNPTLRKCLLETGGTSLAEANPYDDLWGIGYGLHDPLLTNRQAPWGKNELGKALMRFRSSFK